ncbi:MAG TPA: GNAT family N-acetyltransferase [Balneolaceae bacterium]|nr:GNAT family N-acetyltransferase [Balneolaceae bacterium]
MITLATREHLRAINDIYNQAVKDGLRTAHTNVFPMDERQTWFYEHPADRYPIFVFIKNEKVLGWISISEYRSDRQALDEVVEVSYYVHYDYHGHGIGSQLMQQAIDFSTESHYRIMVAILVGDNEPSIGLLKKYNFLEGGRIPNAIHYNQEFHDHLYMYKCLSSHKVLNN